MRTIGILGGVAGGKSLVARCLAQLGAGVLDADRSGHEVLRMESIEAAARERWGDEIFAADGHIDRSRLARIVFADSPTGPREREFLEKLTHPEIAKLLDRQVQNMAKEGIMVAVLDAPLLLESGWDSLCSMLLFVDTPRRLRLARAKQRGWSEKDFAAREGVQESLDSKLARADAIIDNSGSPEHTQAQIEHFWHSFAR
jgi:dephospho-CoA kinase